MTNTQRLRFVLCTGAFAVGSLALSLDALAGGYIVSEVDSAMSARGTAAAAVQDSPSAVYFNPANLTALKGLQTRLGLTTAFPAFAYVPEQGDAVGTDTTTVTPPALSISYHLGNLSFGELAAGFGVYIPYGSTLKWPDEWEGRGELKEISLRVVEVTPALALKPNETFSVGVGLRILTSEVYLERATQFGTEAEGNVELAGSGTEFGVSAGVTIWGFENLTLALTWRSPVIMRYRGTADFDFPPPFDTEARDSDARTRLKLPQVFRLGAAYEIIPDTFNVSADLEFQQWSAYRILKINFEDENGDDWSKEVSERNAEDSIAFHLGAEYILFDALALRAGYIYDERTLPEETVNPGPPDSDRHALTLGASYTLKDLLFFKELSFHAHYSNAFFVRRESTTSPFPGTWRGGHPGDTMAYVFGFSIGANFDIGPVFTYVEEPVEPEAATDVVPAPEATSTPAEEESIKAEPAAEPTAADEAPSSEKPLPEPDTQTQTAPQPAEGEGE